MKPIIRHNNSDPIGIFDSGVGGLTVASQIIKEMPEESIVYFGDTARAPYGVLPADVITEYSSQIMNFLTGKRVKIAVIACNTICVSSYHTLAQNFDTPIFEIVSPAAEESVHDIPWEGAGIGVIATNATVKSGAYQTELLKLNPNIKVYEKACPDLVTLAEGGFADKPEGRNAVRSYLEEFKELNISRLILGCSHFPLYIKFIKEFFGDKVMLIDPAVQAAARVKEALNKSGLNAENSDKSPDKSSDKSSGSAIRDFFVSGETEVFQDTAYKLLGMKITARKTELK